MAVTTRTLLVLLLLGALSFPAPVLPQAPASPAQRTTQARAAVATVHQVPLHKATIVKLPAAAQRVSVGNPGVADILVLRTRELYVVGKALGSTNVVVWGEGGRVMLNFDVEVTHDSETLRARLNDLLPGEDIKVYSGQERLVLSGQVSTTARMDAALNLAAGFLPDCIAASSNAPDQSAGAAARQVKFATPDASCKKGSVVNLMQVGGSHQVMLKVTVAEMSRSVVKRLDANLNIFNFGNRFSGGAVSGGAAFPNALDPAGLLTPVFPGSPGSPSPVGPPVDLFDPNTPVIDTTGLFLNYLSGDVFAQAVLDISKRNGLAKILSEPTLTTLTGQEASFLSGGEFPVPVPQGGLSNSTTIEFKEFGVGLKFLPVVLDSGRINLKLSVSVSEISADNAVVLRSAVTASSFAIPSLSKRSATSTIELADGQTIGIAGLINDNVRDFIDKFPVLGDLPILGILFRSQEYRSGQTELVIFVTPHLARPIPPHQVRLPTDGFLPPSDFGFYVMGDMERKGETQRRSPIPSGSRDDLPQAAFGHDLSLKEKAP